MAYNFRPLCEALDFEKTDVQLKTKNKMENKNSNLEQTPPFCKTDVSGSYKPLTLSRIEEIVDETKDLTHKEQTAVAYSMPITACGLYVLKMKSKYSISVAI